MKILHISPIIHPCFDDLVIEQKKQHSVVFVKLLLTDQDMPYKITKDHKGLIIENVKRSQSYEYDNKLLDIFKQILGAYKPELVHIHAFSGVSLLPILNAASNLRIKKVITLHDHSLFCVQGTCLNGDKRCYLDSLLTCDCQTSSRLAKSNRLSLHDFNRSRTISCQRIIDQCDTVICPSYQQREQLVRLFGEQDKFVTLYYGTKPCAVTGQKKIGSKPTFGYLGTLWQLKGISLIEGAMNGLEGCDFNVLMGVRIFSQDPSETALLERLKHNSKIDLKLDIKREKIYEDFFSQIDYLIIPSIWDETGPMTLFESFSYKVPVIVFNTPSMVEKIKDNASSQVFNNEQELAAIMKGIIEKKIKKNEQDNFAVKGIREYTQEVASIYEGVMAKKPRGLFLRLGLACNSHCEFCVIGANTSKSTFSFSAVKNMLDQSKSKYDFLVLTGGEPTIRKDLLRILEHAYKLGYFMLLQTNARMFAFEEFSDRVAKYNIDFTTHIDGPTAQIHDDIQQAPGSFWQTVKGIKNLQKFDPNILVKILITKNNYQHLLETAKFIAKLGIKEIWFVFLTPYGSARVNFDAVVPRFSEVNLPLTEAVHWLKRNTEVRVTLEGFPHCAIDPEFHPLTMETDQAASLLDGVIPENRSRIYNAKNERTDVQKQKFAECSDCMHEKECEGVYKEYVAKRGRDEFQPVLKEVKAEILL